MINNKLTTGMPFFAFGLFVIIMYMIVTIESNTKDGTKDGTKERIILSELNMERKDYIASKETKTPSCFYKRSQHLQNINNDNVLIKEWYQFEGVWHYDIPNNVGLQIIETRTDGTKYLWLVCYLHDGMRIHPLSHKKYIQIMYINSTPVEIDFTTGIRFEESIIDENVLMVLKWNSLDKISTSVAVNEGEELVIINRMDYYIIEEEVKIFIQRYKNYIRLSQDIFEESIKFQAVKYPGLFNLYPDLFNFKKTSYYEIKFSDFQKLKL